MHQLYDDYHKGRDWVILGWRHEKAASPKNDEAAKICPLGTIQFCTGIFLLYDPNYFRAACAAASLAIGTRKGEQET